MKGPPEDKQPSAEWLRSGAAFPTPAEIIPAVYRRGTQTSRLYLPSLNPILTPIFGRELFPGSLNLHSAGDVDFPFPAVVSIAGQSWTFIPVVIQGRQVAVAARKGGQAASFLEIYSPTGIVDALGLTVGCTVDVAIYSGRHLGIGE